LKATQAGKFAMMHKGINTGNETLEGNPSRKICNGAQRKINTGNDKPKSNSSRKTCNDAQRKSMLEMIHLKATQAEKFAMVQQKGSTLKAKTQTISTLSLTK